VAALLFTLFTLLSASAALLTPVLGQVSQVTDYLPELAHDGCHLLAVACHYGSSGWSRYICVGEHRYFYELR
jgi:hypothetical protein